MFDFAISPLGPTDTNISIRFTPTTRTLQNFNNVLGGLVDSQLALYRNATPDAESLVSHIRMNIGRAGQRNIQFSARFNSLGELLEALVHYYVAVVDYSTVPDMTDDESIAILRRAFIRYLTEHENQEGSGNGQILANLFRDPASLWVTISFVINHPNGRADFNSGYQARRAFNPRVYRENALARSFGVVSRIYGENFGSGLRPVLDTNYNANALTRDNTFSNIYQTLSVNLDRINSILSTNFSLT